MARGRTEFAMFIAALLFGFEGQDGPFVNVSLVLI